MPNKYSRSPILYKELLMRVMQSLDTPIINCKANNKIIYISWIPKSDKLCNEFNQIWYNDQTRDEKVYF